jgi:cardiolipin synthase A/B
VPSRSDMPLTLWAARGEYDGLLAAGVKLYEYHGMTGMTHAKVAVRDGGEWSTAGSSNLDSLSLNHLYEFNYQSNTQSFGQQVQKMVEADIKVSKQITPADVGGVSNLLYKLLDTSIVSYFM